MIFLLLSAMSISKVPKYPGALQLSKSPKELPLQHALESFDDLDLGIEYYSKTWIHQIPQRLEYDSI